MLFDSPQFFAVFLPLTILCYYCLGPSWSNIVLTVASLAFCAQANLGQFFVLAGSVLCNFLAAHAILALSGQPRRQRAALACGVALNLGVLAFFKYSAFVISSLNAVTTARIPTPEIALPLGISFYTFTQVAFLVDVYAGRGPKSLSLPGYALFVTYFPHVIAGPILHWREMMPQFASIKTRAKSWHSDQTDLFCAGLFLFGVGLAKKALIADPLAPVVAKGYASFDSLGFVDAWLTSLSYTFQLYFDFSGYSDMAIGMSMLFGVRLPFNFDAPYRAASIQEFWRRWHMTLSRWLRDYVFIPLGGNRRGLVVTLRNLFVTFLLGGIWHGAGWGFIIWGALHGAAACCHRLWTVAGRPLPRPVGVILTFAFVNAAWVFFRAPDLTSALGVLAAMIEPGRSSDILPREAVLGLAVAGLLVWMAPTSQSLALRTRLAAHPAAAALTGAILALATLAQNSAPPSPFLYFHF